MPHGAQAQIGIVKDVFQVPRAPDALTHSLTHSLTDSHLTDT
jgi:hypothetical protein